MALHVWLHSLYERHNTPTNLVIRSLAVLQTLCTSSSESGVTRSPVVTDTTPLTFRGAKHNVHYQCFKN